MVKKPGHSFGRRRYLIIRQWIDVQIPKNQSEYLVGACLTPMVLPLVTKYFVEDTAQNAIISMSLGVTVALLGFYAWRCRRIFMAAKIKSARHYERQFRHMLPAEYQDATSHTLDVIRSEQCMTRTKK